MYFTVIETEKKFLKSLKNRVSLFWYLSRNGEEKPFGEVTGEEN